MLVFRKNFSTKIGHNRDRTFGVTAIYVIIEQSPPASSLIAPDSLLRPRHHAYAIQREYLPRDRYVGMIVIERIDSMLRICLLYL